MILIDGKKVAAEMKLEIAAKVELMKKSSKKTPHLAAILVGHDGGSETYVAYKIKDCAEVGYKSSLFRFEDDVKEDALLNKVKELNEDDDIDGFIVQLPLPGHISEQKVIESIDPKKDVDGFHPENLGRMVIGLPSFVSATPFGIVELIKRYNIETSGRNCVILGRSNIVGRPLSILMSQKAVNATVTVAHSRTKNIKELCHSADILIAAIGVPGFVKGDMVSEGAVVIDVGTTRVKSDQTKSGWKLKGDVLFEEVADKCSYITPVPGGVGPMTRVSLLYNTLLASSGEIYK
ncbi:MAG: bifunctional 5,10-methylene-tetrahydrofolate dehydrogenase/5,10-methylene-tetrahydrofolate cyclohydrolase [Bacteroidales bacterium]|jgi:methylenetetrahydrofolate dehydrogenase (NADP+)/methenyltetrahydrofolate cyclohydrolase|nr:bifunctional 5,10-methylene-tetrahydrofolate dehydrogenase/5,10-methylene-tetrahydrofolate cyclohydrolase [Bacteroidales bacterium]